MNCPPFVEPIELPSVRIRRLRKQVRQQNRRRWLARCIGLLLTLAVIAVLMTCQASAAPPFFGKSVSVSVGPAYHGVHMHGRRWDVHTNRWIYTKSATTLPYYGGYYGRTYYTRVLPSPLPPPPLPNNLLPLGPPVEIVNPDHNPATVRFSVGGRLRVLMPGEDVKIPYASNQVIEFHRGGQFGKAQYRLRSGTYRFELTDHGWSLYRQPGI